MHTSAHFFVALFIKCITYTHRVVYRVNDIVIDIDRGTGLRTDNSLDSLNPWY